eukprot:TRINITY_DN1123_c0_g1_i1.p1 TRINITY_DN1123_c0_g1~~TRINITY_DN1123_c0_g1_i1.p1  ORF type:complete len:191 (+),score=22.20 TRINITY_DN1123_c0_g1_i1:46-573(+)
MKVCLLVVVVYGILGCLGADVCTEQGGEVKKMAIWHLAPNTGTKINQDVDVCFILNEFGTNHYSIPMHTIDNPTPTLAVLAFNSRITPTQGSGNIALSYCLEMYGTTAVANDHGDMAWYVRNEDGSYDANEHDFCTFADGSMIGTWTLLYHAARDDMGNDIRFGWVQTSNNFPNF